MPQQVTDIRSNPKDQIAHAVTVLGHSADRLAVFLEFHRGKKKIKTVSEVASAINLSRKRVLEEAKKLQHKQILRQTKRDHELAYERDDFFYSHQAEICKQVKDPNRRKSFPTKYNLRVSRTFITIRAPARFARTATITIDELDSFNKVRKIKSGPSAVAIKESRIKSAIQSIIAQRGTFKDWGGEQSDLFTSRVRLNGKRVNCAFAFKGRATRGQLTPARLGKNGDQIQRLFVEDADVFLIQYHSTIAPSVLQQMAAFAQVKSLSTGRKIFYGVIDGADTGRLITAYPKAFAR